MCQNIQKVESPVHLAYYLMYENLNLALRWKYGADLADYIQVWFSCPIIQVFGKNMKRIKAEV